ncbi:MAG TPA: ATP-binding protein [Casimicrobiaceae bacterium]|nr:ATP-binding protein [Casimicrobiaceae bacterium]
MPAMPNVDRDLRYRFNSNLLGNASKYTQNGRAIRLFAKRKRGAALMRVIDNRRGIRGIRHEMTDRVFDMRMQMDPSLESAGDSLAIRLPLSRRLVELHGGHSDARSDRPGWVPR